MSFESFLFNREANQPNKERNEEPPAKRQRPGEDPSETVAAAAAKYPVKVVQQDVDTAIFAAITKIAAHIGSKGKFKKAGSLARQLLASGTLERKHGRAFIKVLETAMLDRPNVNDPALKNDYRALFLAAEANASDIFSKPDQQKLGAWAIRAVLQNELTTDDNYEVGGSPMGCSVLRAHSHILYGVSWPLNPNMQFHYPLYCV
ncbi:hypothetical protein CYMTET_15745 [Cymbomonas tetramitiformis]|uniref:Uncharacterized protein n=1 Tax=Cymbomonas tetramitiformis TaxID=36881 RepID=A0AAE0GDS1_9CHLO|nr:hypothetical protein CYMTET_15745 [Cymbomonas tetramitiformis]